MSVAYIRHTPPGGRVLVYGLGWGARIPDIGRLPAKTGFRIALLEFLVIKLVHIPKANGEAN